MPVSKIFATAKQKRQLLMHVLIGAYALNSQLDFYCLLNIFTENNTHKLVSNNANEHFG